MTSLCAKAKYINSNGKNNFIIFPYIPMYLHTILFHAFQIVYKQNIIDIRLNLSLKCPI